MTVIGETPTTHERLNVALIEWQFVRISNEKLRAVINDFLDEHAGADQLRALSDPKLSDEDFSEIALELFREGSRSAGLRDSPLKYLPPLPEPIGGTGIATTQKPVSDSWQRSSVAEDERDRRGIDWVSLFYTIDDFICGCTSGWLSIPRIAGLMCVIGIVFAVRMSLEETPVQWQKALEDLQLNRQVVTTNQPNNTRSGQDSESYAAPLKADSSRSPANNLEAASGHKGGNQSEFERIAPEGIAPEGIAPEGTAVSAPEEGGAALSASGTSQTLIEPSHERAGQGELDSAAAAIEAEKLSDVMALIGEGSHQTAIELLRLAISEGSIRDNNAAKLLEIEARTRGGTEGRNLAWQKLLELDESESPELCQLYLARWLLTSSVSERTEILLATDTNSSWLAEKAVVWAEARGGSTDPETVSKLRTLVKESPFSICDRIFLATSYFASKKDDMAYELLIEVKDALKDLRFDEETDVVAWLRQAVIDTLNTRLESSVAKLSDRIGFPVSTLAN